jgi:hypothetical protein
MQAFGVLSWGAALRPTADRFLLCAGSLALQLALAASAWGDPPPEAGEALAPGEVIDLVPEALSKARVRVYADETYSLLADFGPADSSEFRTTFGVRAGGPISESFVFRVSAVGGVAFFDIDGDRSGLESELGGASLFEQLNEFQIGLGGAYRLPCESTLFGAPAHWSVFAEGRAKLSWEKDASVADGTKGGGILGVGLALGSRLELALGVNVASRIDGGVGVNPVAGLRWKIRDDMRLRTYGIGLLYEFDFNPEFELQVRGSYESDLYRLDDRGPVLGDPTLRQREVPVLVALRWKPTKHWRVTTGLGSVVYQQWRIEAESGGNKDSVSAGPAALGWLRIEYHF